MPPDTLCFDYAQDTFSNTFQVTAAQNREVDTLLSLAKALRLRRPQSSRMPAHWLIFSLLLPPSGA